MLVHVCPTCSRAIRPKTRPAPRPSDRPHPRLFDPESGRPAWAADPAPFPVSPPLIKWARAIARGVRKDFKFRGGSQEEQDLEGVAYLELVKAAGRFDPNRVPPGGDPDGAFRGYAHVSVAGECKREARRLRNGGTYWTRRERGLEAVEAAPLSVLRTPAGDPFDLPDGRYAG